MNLSYYKLAVILDKDAGGQNGAPNQAVAIYKSDGVTLATIYSDEAGTSPIVQPGAETDAQGNFEFYTLDGEYVAKSGAFETTVSVGTGARIPITADSLKDLASAPRIANRQYSVKGFYAGADVGGGLFYWDASRDKAEHNGGTVIDPNRVDAWDGTHTDLSTLFTVGSGSGCFVRLSCGAGARPKVKSSWFGAIADFNTSDGSGSDVGIVLNQCFSVSDCVEIDVAGRYAVNTSVNMALKYAGARLFAKQGGKISGADNGVRLHGQTGNYPVIDTIGSQAIKLDGFVILEGVVNPSACGVNQCRATTSQYAQFHTLENIVIDVGSDPSANGGLGRVAINNVAAEIATYRDVYALGDTAVYIGAANLFNVPSLYATQGGPTSCSTFYFEGGTVFDSLNEVGQPLHLRSAVACFGSVYVNGASADTVDTYGVFFDGINRGHKLDIFVEFAKKFGKLNGSLTDCDITFLGSMNADRNLHGTSAFNSIQNSNIVFAPTISGAFTSPDYWVSGNFGDVFRNSEIHAPGLASTAYVTAANTEGSRFFAGSNNSLAKFGQIFIEKSGYQEPLRLGSNLRLWVDSSGRVRTKNSAPFSDTDGSVLHSSLTSTTSNFDNASDSVNTSGKYTGKPAFNTTSGRPVWASGSSATAVWVYADGTTAHTPV